MSISPICDICHEQLLDYGAIVLSPPEGGCGSGFVYKFHVCQNCYNNHIQPLLFKNQEAFTKA